MTTTREWADSARAGAAALLAATLLHAAPARAEHGDATCEVPETMVLRGSAGAVTLTRAGAHGTARVLEALDVWTTAKWTLRLFAPGLARDEVAIHLYPQEEAQFLADYDDVDRVRTVRFFVACASEHGYTVAPARVSRSDDDEGTKTELADRRTTAYLGMTIAPEGTMPQATLKGELSAFGPTHAIE